MAQRTGGALAWLDRGVAAVSTIFLALMHVVLFLHAGGLWRDEANSVTLAAMPLRELGANLQFDAFPAVWFAVLRAWTACGLGSTDQGLRALGLLVGLAILAVLWRNARAFEIEAPLVSLALLGCNAAAMVYGDSLRAYGLGMLFGLLSFGLLWDFVCRPGARTFVLALAAAVVSVHCTFYNALILAASCAGGAAVVLRRRDYRALARLVAVGAVAGLPLLIYLPMFESQRSWNFIIRHSMDLAAIGSGLAAAVTTPGNPALWIWAGAVLLGVAVATRQARRSDLAVYCGATLLVIVPGYVLFLLQLSYVTQPWYFLALLSLVACCLDGLLGQPLASAKFRCARAVALIAVMALATTGLWAAVHERRTNLDLVAAKLGTLARRDDLVIVNPWYLGISFQRYYHGPAPWDTVPPLSSHELHRFDLLKQAMISPGDIQVLLDKVRVTLLAGNSVFLVGDLATVSDGAAPPVLPSAPDSPWRFREEPYYRGWQLQVAHELWEHGTSARPVPVSSGLQVSVYEDAPVTVVTGERRSGP